MPLGFLFWERRGSSLSCYFSLSCHTVLLRVDQSEALKERDFLLLRGIR